MLICEYIWLLKDDNILNIIKQIINGNESKNHWLYNLSLYPKIMIEESIIILYRFFKSKEIYLRVMIIYIPSLSSLSIKWII